MNKNSKSNMLILVLLSVSLIVVDWKINIIAFSDILLTIAVLLLFLKRKIYIRKGQILLYFGVLSLPLINVLWNLYFNSSFIISEGVQGTFKVLYYMIIIILFYNFIKGEKLESYLFKILSITSIVVCIIGIYIFLSVFFFKGILPYEFLWTYTRTDIASYTYGGFGTNIVRMRSIFAEPAHLGFYLNTVLAILNFNKLGIKPNKTVERIVIISLLLTFSFSSIAIMVILKVMSLEMKSLYKLLLSKSNLLTLLLIIVVGIGMWETIETTITSRIQRIMEGTDTSARARIFESWASVNIDSLLIGNGMGNSPILFNVYAYILSDLGLVAFLLTISFSVFMALKSPHIGIVFILLNFQKGGYLGAGYWIFLMLIILYGNIKLKRRSNSSSLD